MKLVIQRVKEAHVSIEEKIVGKIHKGMLVFLGIAEGDSQKDIEYCVDKIVQLRMFEDSDGKMNLSAKDVSAEILIVSQFTLLADCKKGRRPSFDKAAEPKKAEELYNLFIQRLLQEELKVETGQFKAMMDVALVNDGPVTFIIESKSADDH